MNATPLVLVLIGFYLSASASILTGPLIGRLQEYRIQLHNHTTQILR